MKYLLFFLISILLSCSNSPVLSGGSGSDSPNAINGTVLFSNDILASSLAKDIIADSCEILLYQIHDTVGLQNIHQVEWEVIDTFITDKFGNFHINKLLPGKYSMLFSQDGYKAFSGYIEVKSSENSSITDTFYLKKAKKISGIVIDTSLVSTIPHFLIKLIGTPYETVTLPNGEFVFNEIPMGNFSFNLIPLEGETIITSNYLKESIKTEVSSNTIVIDRYIVKYSTDQ